MIHILELSVDDTKDLLGVESTRDKTPSREVII